MIFQLVLTSDVDLQLGTSNRLPWLIRKLDYCGFHFNEDDFLRNTLEMAVLVELREIKHRSRIRVEQGITVYGGYSTPFPNVSNSHICRYNGRDWCTARGRDLLRDP